MPEISYQYLATMLVRGASDGFCADLRLATMVPTDRERVQQMSYLRGRVPEPAVLDEHGARLGPHLHLPRDGGALVNRVVGAARVAAVVVLRAAAALRQ